MTTGSDSYPDEYVQCYFKNVCEKLRNGAYLQYSRLCCLICTSMKGKMHEICLVYT
jgi:hypothetical protein